MQPDPGVGQGLSEDGGGHGTCGTLAFGAGDVDDVEPVERGDGHRAVRQSREHVETRDDGDRREVTRRLERVETLDGILDMV